MIAPAIQPSMWCVSFVVHYFPITIPGKISISDCLQSREKSKMRHYNLQPRGHKKKRKNQQQQYPPFPKERKIYLIFEQLVSICKNIFESTRKVLHPSKFKMYLKCGWMLPSFMPQNVLPI